MNHMISFIKSRRSIGNLSLPMPSQDELTEAVCCAMSAPDHKKLQPYHFSVLTGDALGRFGQALLAAGEAKAAKEGATLDDKTQQKLVNMPHRAPMIIAVATDFKVHEKVPEFEQLLCVGASIQNLLLALQSQGYRTVWRTGELCNEPLIKQFFGTNEQNIICGFVYVGSSSIEVPDCQVNCTDFLSVMQ